VVSCFFIYIYLFICGNDNYVCYCSNRFNEFDNFVGNLIKVNVVPFFFVQNRLFNILNVEICVTLAYS